MTFNELRVTHDLIQGTQNGTLRHLMNPEWHIMAFNKLRVAHDVIQ